MATKTTTKSKAPKAPAVRKTAKPAAKSSPRNRTAASKPAKAGKTSERTPGGVKSNAPVATAAIKPTEKRTTPEVKTAAPTQVVTKSAFAPITGKKPVSAPAPVSAPPNAPQVPSVKPMVESVSLIEPHTPKPKRPPIDDATKRTILPPISRIRAPLPTPEPPK